MLELSGFEAIEHQATVEDALLSISRSEPELVILDLHLGDDVSGLDLLTQLRTGQLAATELPVLVCTGDTDLESKRAALTLGATDFLTKPVDVIEVGKRVQNLIESHQLRVELENRVAHRTQDLGRINNELEIEVSGRKKVEGALRQTEQRMRFLLISGRITVYTCTPFPPFSQTFVSPNVTAHLGYEPEEFTADPTFWIDRVHPEDRPGVEAGRREIGKGERITQDYRFRHKDGSYCWVSDDQLLILDSSGNPVEIIGGWFDIGDRVQAQQGLASHAVILETANARLKEFDRLKSEFVATASHEMRTPLTIIREYASQLNDGLAGAMGAEQREMLDAVIRNCDRLRGLLDNLLNLHRIEAHQMEMNRSKVDLTKTIRDCFRDFAPKCRSNGITLKINVIEPVPPTFCDADLIGQVLVNLLSNAVKFTPDGGIITLTAKPVQDRIEISVEDSGKGIAPEAIPKIFEAFSQIDRVEGPGYRGTGLGLTISKKIVEMHGSEFKVISTLGRGSTFSFLLPIWDLDSELAAFVTEKWMQRNSELAGTLMVLRCSTEPGPDREGLLAQIIGRVAVSCPAEPGGLRLASSRLVAAVLGTDASTAEKTLRQLSSHDDLIAQSSIEWAVLGFEATKPIEDWMSSIERSFKPLGR